MYGRSLEYGQVFLSKVAKFCGPPRAGPENASLHAPYEYHILRLSHDCSTLIPLRTARPEPDAWRRKSCVGYH